MGDLQARETVAPVAPKVQCSRASVSRKHVIMATEYRHFDRALARGPLARVERAAHALLGMQLGTLGHLFMLCVPIVVLFVLNVQGITPSAELLSALGALGAYATVSSAAGYAKDQFALKAYRRRKAITSGRQRTEDPGADIVQGRETVDSASLSYASGSGPVQGAD